MARFLLVHGRHHGAWCWRRVVAELEARGHVAIAIDLPGQGEDAAPPQDVTVEATLDRIKQELEPRTVLVGHSLGGFWGHRAAGEAPESVGRMVYLCTLVARKGESWAETVERHPGSVIDNSLLNEEGTAIVPPPDYADVVGNRCTAEDMEMALSRLRPLPLQSLVEAGMAPEPHDPHPNAVAIVCEDDLAQPPDAVQSSADAVGVPVRRIPGDHSPFFSAVDALVDALEGVASE